MKQHPVPQNISSYKFRLVGDMTLKQFLELLGGVLVAYLFFASNLIFFIKWPLVIFSAFSGVALAFFPVEERPLDEWVINFLKSIYSPTRYIWKKTGKTPEPLTYKKSTQKTQATTQKAQKTKAPQTPASFQEEEMDTKEKTRLEKISGLLNQLPSSAPSSAPTPSPTSKKQKAKVSVRKLTPKDQTTVFKSKSQPPQLEKKQATQEKEVSKKDQAQEQEETVVFKKPTVTKQKTKAPQKSASYAKNMPIKPGDPNIVVGVVTDSDGRLVSDAIVEINNQEGVPQRAVKTNQLGQFSISTPLQKGQYTIKIDDKNLNISPKKLEIKNEIIRPLHLHPDTTRK